MSSYEVIEYYSKDCSSCKAIKSKLELFSENHPEVQILFKDVEDYPDDVNDLCIMSVPYLLIKKNGEVVDFFQPAVKDIVNLEERLESY